MSVGEDPTVERLRCMPDAEIAERAELQLEALLAMRELRDVLRELSSPFDGAPYGDYRIEWYFDSGALFVDIVDRRPIDEWGRQISVRRALPYGQRATWLDGAPAVLRLEIGWQVRRLQYARRTGDYR